MQQLFFSGAIKSMSIKSRMSPLKYDSPPFRNKQSYEIYIKLYKSSLAALKFLNTYIYHILHFTNQYILYSYDNMHQIKNVILQSTVQVNVVSIYKADGV